MADSSQHRADLERHCREAGVSLTLQRRIILSVLSSRSDHPTADQVYEAVVESYPEIARTTVYRTLEVFVEHGLLVRVCHPGSSTRYDVVTHRHHHLVCDRCGALADLEEPSLNDLSLPDLTARGFLMRDYSVHIRGLCKECTLSSPLDHDQ